MSVLRDIQFELNDPGLVEALRQLALLQWTWNALQAQAEQESAAHDLPEARCVDGIGQLRRNIHTFAYHDWVAKEGPGIITDPTWNRYMDRVAPETKVKPVRSKPGAGYESDPGSGIAQGWSGEKRFVKVYRAALNPAPAPPSQPPTLNSPECSPSPMMNSLKE